MRMLPRSLPRWIQRGATLMPALALYEAPELYDLAFGPGPCEPFYREEARRAAGPVLELACGTGRLTVPIARDGHEIVGLDASPAMLGAARCKAKQARLRGATFVRADMRSFALEGRFALVIVSCNSLAHLTTNDDLTACFFRIREHLRPGGTVAFDIVNPDVTSLSRSAEAVCLDTVLGCRGISVRETADYDPVTPDQNRELAGAGRSTAGPHTSAPLPATDLSPGVTAAARNDGAEAGARYGDFDLGPFSGESLNQICLCSA